ncbi:tetraspanin-9-like [Panonychus citri]|uniref:tetraspanin-9-like n=1 Tax=Panonychus citri TaxID=50023 RepID=UPI0023082800|nr:tetraspanin-9-like [Panonychus citri]
MMSKTGYTCIRRSLCLFNFIFWVSGAVLFAFGLWLNLSLNSYSRVLSPYHLLSAGNLMIAIGFLVFSVSLCGLCGSWFQNKWLLGAFLFTIVLIMALEVVTATLGYVIRDSIRDTLQDELLVGIKSKYNLNDTNGLVSFWDTVQTNLDCCGVNSHKDWFQIDAWKTETKVPESCCNREINITNMYCAEGDLRDHGCYIKLKRALLENLHWVAITCVIFAFVQFFSVVSSLLMICTVDHRRNYRPVKNNRSPTYNRVPTL